MTRDAECVDFLRWALPRLGLRWDGYRKVRRQVCRRASRRASELGLGSLAAYRSQLERDPREWDILAGFTAITISRFYRDRGIFAFLEQEAVPQLAAAAVNARRHHFDVWSAGCASGEEPYTIALLWNLAVGPMFPGLELRVLATDIDPAVLERARRACYRSSSLKELPPERVRRAFVRRDDEYCLHLEHRRAVELRHHDIRTAPPDGPFDLVLCRNLAFTYFDCEEQRHVCGHLKAAIRSGGALVIGSHEALPTGVAGFAPWPGSNGVYRRLSPPPGR
jgi:chemotaxis protein methyltransferase CheR